MNAIEYVRANIDMNNVRHTIKKMEQRREPLYSVNPTLSDTIYDLMEEYCEQQGLPENHWLTECDEDDIIFLL